MKRIIYLVTEDWYFCSHRLELASEAVAQGYEVFLITNVSEHADQITSKNIKLIPVKFSRSFKNPVKDIFLLFRVFVLYTQIKPDIVHHVALKPILLGSIAGFFVLNKIKLIKINAITGMGSLFLTSNLFLSVLRKVIISILKLSLNRKFTHLVVQNTDDLVLFRDLYGINEDKISLIRGAGVNTLEFRAMKQYRAHGSQLVIMVSRLLKDKGVEDYIDAIRILKRGFKNVEFALVGKIDNDNPSSISMEDISKWEKDGLISWWGNQKNMAEIYNKAAVVVLPSYREGLPKVLLEASACSVPIVSTDVPGCREIVRDGYNGYLIPVRNPKKIAEAIAILLNDKEMIEVMGANGRKLVEEHFSSKIIVKQTLDLYVNLLK